MKAEKMVTYVYSGKQLVKLSSAISQKADDEPNVHLVLIVEVEKQDINSLHWLHLTRHYKNEMSSGKT